MSRSMPVASWATAARAEQSEAVAGVAVEAVDEGFAMLGMVGGGGDRSARTAC